MAILEALRINLPSFHDSLLMESDAVNAFSWVSLGDEEGPWKFQLYLNETKSLVSSIQMKFWHVGP